MVIALWTSTLVVCKHYWRYKGLEVRMARIAAEEARIERCEQH
jgi:hypothetical protein